MEPGRCGAGRFEIQDEAGRPDRSNCTVLTITRPWKREGVARPCGWTQAIAALGEMAAALRAHRVDQDESQAALLLGLETRHQNAQVDADAAQRIVGVRDECEGERLS